MPLADQIRPDTLDDVVGQEHLLGKGKPLRRIIESGHIPNMIFYGPSGIGKTTVARIIASSTNMKLYKLNGTSASTADIKAIIGELGTFASYNGVLLYLDEIQYFNKKQQQSLLEFIEDGSITLIASTTENPYFYVYSAILSRATVFEFKPVSPQETVAAVRRAFDACDSKLGIPLQIEDGVCEAIAFGCGGDVRKAINAVELCALSAQPQEGCSFVSLELARDLSQRSSMRYDRDGDEHYDILSAFQKSIRGSDENAALHYLARLLEAGDLPSACRRLLVTAAEDVGLAYPQAIAIVKACVDSALQVGLPEACLPLAQGVILLCTAPKSNSASTAIWDALADVRSGHTGEIPAHLKDSHYGGAKKMGRGLTYQYPHQFAHHYVEQQYLPDALKDKVYYTFGDNKVEQAAMEYRRMLRRSIGKEEPQEEK